MGKLQAIRQPATDTVSLENKIDRYGELKRQIALVAPAEEEAKILKEQIEQSHDGSSPDLPVVARGNVYEIQMSARRNERTVLDKRKVFGALKKALGMDGIIAVLDIPFGLVDKHIPESQLKTLVHKERSGYRTFDVIPLNPVVPEKKAA